DPQGDRHRRPTHTTVHALRRLAQPRRPRPIPPPRARVGRRRRRLAPTDRANRRSGAVRARGSLTRPARVEEGIDPTPTGRRPSRSCRSPGGDLGFSENHVSGRPTSMRLTSQVADETRPEREPTPAPPDATDEAGGGDRLDENLHFGRSWHRYG